MFSVSNGLLLAFKNKSFAPIDHFYFDAPEGRTEKVRGRVQNGEKKIPGGGMRRTSPALHANVAPLWLI